MTPSDPEVILTTYLTSILTVNAISVPVIGYITIKYQENRGHGNAIGKSIAKFYKTSGWAMIIVLVLGAIGSVLLILFLSGQWQITLSDILLYTTIDFLMIALLIPAMMLIIGYKELR